MHREAAFALRFWDMKDCLKVLNRHIGEDITATSLVVVRLVEGKGNFKSSHPNRTFSAECGLGSPEVVGHGFSLTGEAAKVGFIPSLQPVRQGHQFMGNMARVNRPPVRSKI
ncbi:hypothetical protein Nepgr_008480 [Nepenthes gracilis]|uniref:Uncharacterized protein n=1 Tax=Nepenthes gracilis TaxID=150966 RepID=A0AAD3S947_NEPGR|nr:hypothetical protein Nepgr_008480 [Nepenthes gracilis]